MSHEVIFELGDEEMCRNITLVDLWSSSGEVKNWFDLFVDQVFRLPAKVKGSCMELSAMHHTVMLIFDIRTRLSYLYIHVHHIVWCT